jgi:hypothetical protein
MTMAWMADLAALTRRHLPEIAVSLTAMALVVLGPLLNKGLKAAAAPLPWLLRYGIFVLFTTVGAGLLTHFGIRGVTWALRGLPDARLLGAVAGAHLLIAWVLKRENQI